MQIQLGLNEIHYYPVQNVMTEDRMFRAGQLHVTSTLPSQKCPVYIEENNPDLRIDPYMGTYFYRLNTKHPVSAEIPRLEGHWHFQLIENNLLIR